MSLTLLQGYSSAEEEEEHEEGLSFDEEGGRTSSSISDDDGEGLSRKKKNPTAAEDSKSPFFASSEPSSNSSLPSAFAAFSEVSGPPDFLNNSVENFSSESRDSQRDGPRGLHPGWKRRKERKELPPGVVVEGKAQLVGIRDRVRSDLDGVHPPTSGSGVGNTSEAKRVVSAANPGPEDAADLLRICLQCGVPKTYTHTRGMICPICGDRPPADPNAVAEKKKGSTVKDKEKSKRMRGQSSHATWKSETEMSLRQQFD